MAAPMNNKNHLIHGCAGTRLYHIWKSMRQRCLNKNNSRYEHYGLKGICICDKWNDFENFKKWAISNGYNDSLTLDRIYNDKNYEPSNCRWVTQKSQQRNRTNNVLYFYNGKERTLAEISDLCKVGYKKLWARLKRGWSLEKATES